MRPPPLFQKHPVHYNAGLDSEHFKSHIAEVDTVRELLLTINFARIEKTRNQPQAKQLSSVQKDAC